MVLPEVDMDSIQRIDVKPTYSEAVIHNRTVYLSGQVPWINAGKSIQEQATEVFKHIDDRLRDAGSDKEHILSMQVFLKNPEDYSKFNEMFIAWIPTGAAPARNTICGIQFPTANWDLEIVVVAALI
jgi:enamine deaminase RidA (YjgF/YER057c/UK114 family)